MKYLSIIIVCVFASLATTLTLAQDFQQLSAEFMQKWQAANTARMAGEYEKAIGLFEECLDPKFDNKYLASTKSTVYMALGFLYTTYLNQREEARMYLEKHIETVQASPQANVPGMEQLNAANETMIASSYRMMNNYEKMIEHIEKAIGYYDAYWTGDSPYKMDEKAFKRTLAPSYYYLGAGYKQMEQAEKAGENFKKAAEMYESLLAEDHPADVEMMLSYVYYELGHIDKCIEYLLKFMERSAQDAAGDETRLLMLEMMRNALARYYYQAEQWKNAMAETGKSIKAAEALGWTSDLWRAYHLKGMLYEKMGDPDSALDAYKKAVEIIESQRSGINTGDDRASFMAMHVEVYNGIIKLLIEMNRPEDALEYLERSKARSFLDMLGGRKLGLKSEKETSSLEKQLEIQKEISGLTLAMIQPAGATAENAGKLRGAKKRYGELMVELKGIRPEFSSIVSVSPPDMTKIKSLLDEKSAIVEYFPSEEALYIWVIKNNGIKLVATDTPAKKIAAQIKMLRSKVTRGDTSDAYKRNAKKLFKALIEPIVSEISGVENLIIVPHGRLHYLPFSMLTDGKEFLIDNHVISVAPSSSSLAYILEKGGSKGGKLLALGDPETALNPLPAARKEVSAIGASFPNSDVYLGGEAIETILTGGKAAAADIIHIASHGLFYPDKPMFSALALNGDGANDGFLQVHEIFGLDLSEAELVTLSACETGLSAISEGDELVGLSRAFIYAGTPRVIVSLWQVDDVSTGELMKKMYAKTGELGVATALRNAQLELKSNPDFAHPFFWAPFQLIGNWR